MPMWFGATGLHKGLVDTVERKIGKWLTFLLGWWAICAI